MPLDWDRIPLRRVPTQQRSRDKVARALAAADELVRAEGAEAITLVRVAEQAGVSVGALYQYLPDREAIVSALVWRYHTRLEDLFAGAIDSARQAPPTSDPLGWVISAVVEIYRDEVSVRTLRAAGFTAALDDQRRAHKQRMAAGVASLLEVTGILARGPESAVAGTVAFFAADAVLHEAFASPDEVREAMVAELTRLLRAYIGER